MTTQTENAWSEAPAPGVHMYAVNFLRGLADKIEKTNGEGVQAWFTTRNILRDATRPEDHCTRFEPTGQHLYSVIAYEAPNDAPGLGRPVITGPLDGIRFILPNGAEQETL